jgi:hypothetical protein
VTQPKSLADIDDQHLAIVGKTGSGKTYTAKGVVEHRLDAKGHVIISDPTGAWWGVTLTTDGKAGPAHRRMVIIGGEHGHVPFPVETAAIRSLAQLIMRDRISCILDTSEMLAGERISRLTTFFEQLYSSATGRPCHLVLDEADELARQNPLNEGKRLFHHVDRIVRRGRVKGFRVLMITQRPAVLHKDVLTQANALIAMRLTSPQDRSAIKAWIEGQADLVKGKAVIDSLPSLKPGTGWIWRPDEDLLLQQKMPRISSYDSSKTPEEGDVAVQQPAAASPAVLALLRGVVAPPPATAAKRPAMDEAQLQDLEDRTAILQRIADLERENVQLMDARDAALTRVSQLEAQNAGLLGWIENVKGSFAEAITRMSGAQVELDDARAQFKRSVEADFPFVPIHPPEVSRSVQKRVAAMKGEPAPTFGLAHPKLEGAVNIVGSWNVLAGHMKLMATFGVYPDAKRSVQETIAGLAPGGSTASTYISRMKSKGEIEPNANGGFRLKKGYQGPRPDKRDIYKSWSKLGSKPLEMVHVLSRTPTSALTREELAKEIGLPHTGSTFSTYLSRLRSSGLVIENNKRFELITEVRRMGG